MTGSSKLQPEIIVDSMYRGSLNPELKGQPVDITPCIDVMEKDYRQISKNYELDEVLTTVRVRKGAFVEQAVLKHIIESIEAED